MRKGEFLATLVIGVLVGIGLLAIVFLRGKPATVIDQDEILTQLPVATSGPISTQEPGALYVQNTITPTAQPKLLPALPEIANVDDVLLLYNPGRPTTFSTNFCLLAEFYGLGCKKLGVTSYNSITAELLKDDNGKPYKLIGIDARILDSRFRSLADRDFKILLTEVKNSKTNIYISKVNSLTWANSLRVITDGAVTGIQQPQDTSKDWEVSSSAPEITKELTGLKVMANQTGIIDNYSIISANSGTFESLITSKDNSGNPYTVFARIKPSAESGMIFIDSSENAQSIDKVPLRDIYYSASSFTHVIPTMMAFRYSFGKEVWHSSANFANLTIDDSVLLEPYLNLNYSALLELMQQHNFHTTVGLKPVDWKRSDPNVVTLFLTNPDYFSVAQYGNTGVGYEFYLYKVEPTVTSNSALLPTRTIDDQRMAISEGLSRMTMLQSATDLLFDQIMIFPGGISPKETFKMLKSYGYLGTVNVQDVPLGETRPTAWNYGMYPAITDYFGFPNYIRRIPDRSQAYEPALLPSYLDLFAGKPALFFTSPADRSMFASGMDAFNPIADEINRIVGPLEWRSLGYIARHLFSEKENDDGSLSIKMYSRELVLTNDSKDQRIMHISVAEYPEIPATELTVNGYVFPYRIEGDLLKLDVTVPAGADMRISIEYKSR